MKSLRISAEVSPSAPKPVNTVSSVVVTAPSSNAFCERFQLFVSRVPSGAGAAVQPPRPSSKEVVSVATPSRVISVSSTKTPRPCVPQSVR